MSHRILHILGTAEVGGTERQLLLLLRGLDRERFDCRLLLIRGGPLEGEFRELIPTTVLGKSARFDPRFLTRLHREIRAVRPDLVHTWLPTANLWGGLAASTARVPHWVMSERALDEWKGRGRAIVESLIARRAEWVVANSRAVAAAAAARGISPERLRVIYNAVEIPTAFSECREPGLIVVLGRIDPLKGHDILIDALPSVLREIPEARVVFAGAAVLDIEREFRDMLISRISATTISDRIEFLGHVPDPRPLLHRASVVALPSRQEGFPNVVLEAMAHGTPVVAAAVGGVPEIVESGATGILVSPEDPKALAAALIHALRNPSESSERATRAKEFATRRFSAPAMVANWSALYGEVLGLSR